MRMLRILILSFLLAGCSAKHVHLDLPSNSAPTERSRELLLKIKDKANQLATYRVFGVARNKIGDDTYRVRYLFVARAPSNLRFESFPMNSGMAMTALKSDGGNSIFLDLAPEIIYVGRSKDSLMKKVLGVPVPPNDVIYLLAGIVPLNELEGRSNPVIFESEESVWLRSDNQQRVYELDPKTLNLRKLTVFKSNKKTLVWQALWDGYSESEIGDSIPTQMTIELPAADYFGTFNWRIAEYNPELSPDLFDTTPPVGWEIKNLD